MEGDQSLKQEPKKLIGKRLVSMSDCVATIISRETNWLKWKENKAQSFEKPLSEFVTSKKKRDQKHMNKLLGTHPILIQAGSKDVNYAKRGAKMRKYIKAPKE